MPQQPVWGFRIKFSIPVPCQGSFQMCSPLGRRAILRWWAEFWGVGRHLVWLARPYLQSPVNGLNAMSELCKALNHPDFSLTEAELRSWALLIKWQEHSVRPRKLDLNDFHPPFSLPPTQSVLISQQVIGTASSCGSKAQRAGKRTQGELGPCRDRRVAWGSGWKWNPVLSAVSVFPLSCLRIYPERSLYPWPYCWPVPKVVDYLMYCPKKWSGR